MENLDPNIKLRIKSVELAMNINATSHLYVKEEDVMKLAETIYEYLKIASN